jgi:hypothetical protein
VPHPCVLCKGGNLGPIVVHVDPDEAQILIELIETLIKDWYIARYERQKRLKAIKQISDAKAAAKSGITKAP